MLRCLLVEGEQIDEEDADVVKLIRASQSRVVQVDEPLDSQFELGDGLVQERVVDFQFAKLHLVWNADYMRSAGKQADSGLGS